MTRTALVPEALGEAIQRRREAVGYSRPDLAKAAVVSYPYLYEIERGKKVPSAEALEKIAGALEIEPWRLEEDARELAAAQGLEAPVAKPVVGSAMPQGDDEDAFRGRVDRLTADVMSRVEPIVRDAIIRAIQESR
ncbi:helix-turn-helix domain-containing protein [Nocardioides ferulae]|uniref:helix-turn-helix domain-containing protein n=1 Tax=Nocardioides ferulae TaxID=2340821 RepID=UPI000EAD4112|nr:helix-turn-helix transcriptional regulator [Nocardioides ferulae]